MTLVVTFTGTIPIPISGSSTAYKIWSYQIEASGGGNLQVGQRIALALPSDVDVQNPGSYPGVPLLVGTFVEKDPSSSRQYVGRVITAAGPQTVSFVAPASETTHEVLLVKAPSGDAWTSLPFATSNGGTPSHVHILPAPVKGALVSNGRPVANFAGTLPYASEVFGVYQPLAGWLGLQNTLRVARGTAGSKGGGLSREAFSGASARALSGEALTALANQYEVVGAQGVLSPVGLVNLFREYFFEFDTFLGVAVGHVWVSPGGVVELVETSSRRTLVEKAVEQSEETSRKVEESLTQQDDVADAVKEDNANDTKLGVSVTGGMNTGIYHADASASFSTQSTIARSSEETHKHARTQSSKVTSEIKRNFKTTFKTVTETTDTSSRRYVLQNTTGQLINYELRRKMRKVGVQVQHIGTRLSWQVYIDTPGRDLGLGDLIHVVPAPDTTSIQKPDILPPPADKQVPFHGNVPFILYQGADDEAEDTYTTNPNNQDQGIFVPDVGTDDIIQFRFDYSLPPPPSGYVLSELASIDFHGAQVKFTAAASDLGMSANPDSATNKFALRLTHANFQSQKNIPFDAVFVYTPTPEAQQAVDQMNSDAAAAYDEAVAQLQREAYGNAVRDRLKLVSSMRPRPSEDLRSEERQTVYGKLIRQLAELFDEDQDEHLVSELIRQVFDVDEMLYFVAPDFWRLDTDGAPPAGNGTPPTEASVGKYPVPDAQFLKGTTVASWYSYTDNYKRFTPPDSVADEWRVNYLITEQTQPAPLGSSLGWLIQIDGDERRNEFLNASWVKAVLPVRPGHELVALQWLTEIEQDAALDQPYPIQPGDPPEYGGMTIGEVLEQVASDLQNSNTDISNTLATEMVFETGFNPLSGGFRPAEPYQIFDQWIEVLPTDQVVAVQVSYDPKTGQQI